MTTLASKNSAVNLLVESVAAAYGPDVFSLDDQQPDSPDHVILTSARDRRFTASIINLPEQPRRFSVMVELYDPPEPQLIPFEIAENGEFSLAAVVELLGRYQEWHR